MKKKIGLFIALVLGVLFVYSIQNISTAPPAPTPPPCGDGVLDSGEECDDGNLIGGDGCSETCTIEQPYCGDGNLDPGEECDDGNLIGGDGCSATCTIEPYCGDGNLDPGEECDDGNYIDFDGCQADCTLPYCGDGYLDPGEECDDGNDVDGDGCSATCTYEDVEGGQGCTPGYWKQEQHFDSWVGYSPNELFSDVFGVDAFPGRTLLDVLWKGGGGLKALGRHTVAALLSASSPGVDYDLTTTQVIAMFLATYDDGDGSRRDFNDLKDVFEYFNELGCPLD